MNISEEYIRKLKEENQYLRRYIKASGKEVLTLLTEEIKVDLAIIDYNMPGLSGLETIAEIRKLNLDIPIILSSGSMWSDERLELEKYQISGQLQKPYEFEAMLAIINKFI